MAVNFFPGSHVSKAGGMAGTAVDVSLYPLDTIKTRLQSSKGFWKAGGFTGVYQGLSAAVVGSAPGGGHMAHICRQLISEVMELGQKRIIHDSTAICTLSGSWIKAENVKLLHPLELPRRLDHLIPVVHYINPAYPKLLLQEGSVLVSGVAEYVLIVSALTINMTERA